MVDWLDTGKAAPAYVSLPADGAKGPGVVVLHSFWGLNDFFRRFCDRLAEAGFVAAAPDLYDGAVAATVEEAQRRAKELDFEQALVKVLGAVEFLKAHPAVAGGGLGAVGFSMGAAWAMLLSTVQPEDISAAVIFYGTTQADFSGAKAAFQGHFAPQDPWEPEEDIRALEESLRSAGREVTFYTYPETTHWFFEDSQPDAFRPEAARLAWERTLAFLKTQLRSGA